MVRLVMALMLLASPALAAEGSSDPAALQNCRAIGQTARGELVFALDCQAIKTNYPEGYQPNMPPTNLKETVIPNSGSVDTPPTTTPKAESK